jgi:hypothetical protein
MRGTHLLLLLLPFVFVVRPHVDAHLLVRLLLQVTHLLVLKLVLLCEGCQGCQG